MMWEQNLLLMQFSNKFTDAETPLYPGSINFTRLSTVLRLMNLKAMNRFTELLQFLNDMLLEGNTLPNQNYEAKKILCLMGMEYKINTLVS